MPVSRIQLFKKNSFSLQKYIFLKFNIEEVIDKGNMYIIEYVISKPLKL